MPKPSYKHAIHLATSGAALTLSLSGAAQASTTIYNLYNASTSPTPAEFATDGWVWGKEQHLSPGNATAATPGWVGSSCPTCTPFGFKGGMAINWAAHITQSGDPLIISQQDAKNRYGVYADIDTSAGAWHSPDANHGTRHSIDIGLFKSEISQTVNFTISGIDNPNNNYGITIFKGMAEGPEYNHYGYPLFDTDTDYLDYSKTITIQTTNGNTTTTTTTEVYHYLDYVARTIVDPDTHLTNNTLSFAAEAGQIYTIMLGGNNGTLYDGYAGYQLNISSVPVPASAWLFASAISGLLGLNRRKKSKY